MVTNPFHKTAPSTIPNAPDRAHIPAQPARVSPPRALLSDEEELAQGRIFPRLSKIRDISLEIACSVIQTAAEDGHCSNRSAEILECQGMDGLKAYVKSKMFKPCYSPLVYLPPGVGE